MVGRISQNRTNNRTATDGGFLQKITKACDISYGFVIFTNYGNLVCVK